MIGPKQKKKTQTARAVPNRKIDFRYCDVERVGTGNFLLIVNLTCFENGNVDAVDIHLYKPET